MLVVLHPRCKTLFIHDLTNFSLRFKTVVSTYTMNSGNGMCTSLNFNKALAYDSSVGDSTNSFQALTIFSTISLFFSLSFLTCFLSTFASLGSFGLTLQFVMHLALHSPQYKKTKHCVCFRENCGSDIHQSTIPVGDNHLMHVVF
jgi:hypothetical protein